VFMVKLFTKLKLFHYATNIPLRLYDGENRLLSSALLKSQSMPTFLRFDQYEKELVKPYDDTFYYTNDLNEHYYSFGFACEGKEYRLVAGPSIDSSLSKKQLMMISSQKNLRLSDYDELESYFRSLPHYTSVSLRSTQPLLRYMLSGEEPDLSKNMQKSKPTKEFEEKKAKVAEEQRYHHSPNKDAMILEAVRNGDRGKVFSLVYTQGDGPEGILCKDDPLRSYKNMFIVNVSHITKAVIEGGVDSETAYTLSDTYIQTVEEIDSYEEVTKLHISMLNSFLDLVERAKRMRYTKQVYITIDYINKHYYESISVKELAQRVHMSESHLLKLFTSQTGMNISSFIINKRITEAANLLRYTNYSITQICNMTGFNDQSYMTKQFKRHFKTTPKKYKEQIIYE